MSSLRGIKRSPSVRKKAFVRCCRDGVPHCEGCGIEINARTGIIYEHAIPAGLGGDRRSIIAKVHCKTCADIKTETEDKPRMAKADRVLKARHGMKKKGRPMPGSKASGGNVSMVRDDDDIADNHHLVFARRHCHRPHRQGGDCSRCQARNGTRRCKRALRVPQVFPHIYRWNRMGRKGEPCAVLVRGR